MDRRHPRLHTALPQVGVPSSVLAVWLHPRNALRGRLLPVLFLRRWRSRNALVLTHALRQKMIVRGRE
jgi:hypothetical protein